MKNGKRVEVFWVDSAHASTVGWHDKAQTVTPASVMSLGYVHEDKPDYLVLVAEWATSGQVTGLTAIPKSAIRKVRKLRGQ